MYFYIFVVGILFCTYGSFQCEIQKFINLADFLNAKTHKINSEINVNCNRKMAPKMALASSDITVYYFVVCMYVWTNETINICGYV